MKRKSIITACVLVIAVLAVVLLNPFGKKPFAKLSADEIVSAELFLIPPETTIKLTEKEDLAELTDILNELVIYRKDDSGRDYNGQLVQVTITLKNGQTHIVGAFNPFLFLNNNCYRTKYEPCEKLNVFGNRILKEQ